MAVFCRHVCELNPMVLIQVGKLNYFLACVWELFMLGAIRVAPTALNY